MRFSCEGGSYGPSGWVYGGDANGDEWDPADATASIMLLTFICGRASMLQRLELDWGGLLAANVGRPQLTAAMFCRTASITCSAVCRCMSF